MDEKDFEVKKENLPQILDYISDWCDANLVNMKLSTKLNVCADEVVSNVIFYSGASVLKVSCEKTDSEIIITFSDDGKEFNPLTEAKDPDVTAAVEDREIGGLGIFMVKKMMNSVEYKHYENKNILSMKLSQ